MLILRSTEGESLPFPQPMNEENAGESGREHPRFKSLNSKMLNN